MVWRTLLQAEPHGLVYDVMDAYRLMEIEFARDVVDTEDLTDGDSHIRQLETLPLLTSSSSPRNLNRRCSPRCSRGWSSTVLSAQRPTLIFSQPAV